LGSFEEALTEIYGYGIQNESLSTPSATVNFHSFRRNPDWLSIDYRFIGCDPCRLDWIRFRIENETDIGCKVRLANGI